MQHIFFRGPYPQSYLRISIARNILGQEMTIEQQVDLDAGVIMPKIYPEQVNDRNKAVDATNRTIILKIKKRRN